MGLLLLMFPFSLGYIGLLCLLLFLHVNTFGHLWGFVSFVFFCPPLPCFKIPLPFLQFHPAFVFITTCPIHCTYTVLWYSLASQSLHSFSLHSFLFLLLLFILLLRACSFPSPPNLNRGAMPSPGWHTVKLQLQPSASPAQSTATLLGMR